MNYARRKFLFAGTATIALLAAGLSAFDEVPLRDGDAYQPWRDWRTDEPGPLYLIRSATLAASPHNTQPWEFRIEEGRIQLFADESRNVGAMDPFRREMHISLGCALENMAIAATKCGLLPQVVVVPGSVIPSDGEIGLRHTATISFAYAVPAVSPLVETIPYRHTNRGPYDADRPIPQTTLDRLRTMAEGVDPIRLILLTDPQARRNFAGATIEATRSIIADAAMVADSDAWFRGSDAEIEAHRDGSTLYAAGLSPFILRLAKLMPSLSPERAHDAWFNQTADVQLAGAPMIGLIAVPDLYDRQLAVLAGRLWQRLHLQGTLLGLGMQPMNQLPERVDREAQCAMPPYTADLLAQLTGEQALHATFAFRLGWPLRPASASPRRAIEQVVIAAR